LATSFRGSSALRAGGEAWRIEPCYEFVAFPFGI
jgi:hypothetical protein